MQIPGQVGLFEFLMDKYHSLPEVKVNMNGAIDTKELKEINVQTTYRDIFLIINMLDDYVKILTQPGRENNVFASHMISQFERISEELTEQIGLDKEKMYKKCHKVQQEGSDVGEDAMALFAGTAGKEREIKNA